MFHDLLRLIAGMVEGLLTIGILLFPLMIPFIIAWVGPKPKSRRRGVR